MTATSREYFPHRDLVLSSSFNRPRILNIFQLKAVIPFERSSPENVIGEFQKMVKHWLEGKYPTGRFPIKAIQGQMPFPTMADGLTFEVIALSDSGVWAFRFLHPDSEGRIWKTELAYRQVSDRLLFGAKLTCSVINNQHIRVSYSMPNIVRYALNRIGMRDSALISCDAKIIADIQELKELKDLITSPARTLPVIVFSGVERKNQRPGILGEYALDDVDRLADDLLGLAHVVKLPFDLAFEWTKAVGRGWSVYNGAVRTYYPGTDFKKGNPNYHPIVFIGRILSWSSSGDWGESNFQEYLSNKIRYYSGNKHMVWGDLLFMDDAQSMKASYEYNRMYEQVIDDMNEHNQKIVKIMKEQYDRELTNYIEKIKLLNQDLELYSDVNERLEADLDQLSNEYEQQISINRSLSRKIDSLKRNSISEKATSKQPESYEEVRDWIINEFSEAIYLHPRATNGLLNADYEDVGRLCDGIKFLATSYRDSRRGVISKQDYDELLAQSHFEISRSITDTSAGQHGEMYKVNYHTQKGQKRKLEYHLRHGTSRESRYCLRIYFFWDEDEEKVVIGWMPSHLDTAST